MTRNEILESAARAAERLALRQDEPQHAAQARLAAASIRALKMMEATAESAPAATPRRDALMDACQKTLDLAMSWRDERIEDLRRDLRDARTEIAVCALEMDRIVPHVIGKCLHERIRVAREELTRLRTENERQQRDVEYLGKEIIRAGNALDEFAPNHTGKSLLGSIREAMAMLRGALARERVGRPPCRHFQGADLAGGCVQCSRPIEQHETRPWTLGPCRHCGGTIVPDPEAPGRGCYICLGCAPESAAKEKARLLEEQRAARTEAPRCPTCDDRMENQPRAGHPVWYVCRGCDQVDAGG